MTCPTHRTPLQPYDSIVGTIYACKFCDYHVKETQIRSDASGYKPRPLTLVDRVEFQLEAELVEACRVEALSRKWLFIRVGQRKAKGSGTDLGAQDFQVRVPSWPRGLWMAFESKVGGNTFTDAQAAYVAQGAILECWTVRAMVEAVKGVQWPR